MPLDSNRAHRRSSAPARASQRRGAAAERHSTRAGSGGGAASSSASAGKHTSNVKVVVRCRPLSAKEKEHSKSIATFDEHGVIHVTNPSPPDAENAEQTFHFDEAFAPQTTSKEVFASIGQPLVDAFIEGFNASILAYGQTGSGKTYSMMGLPTEPGVVPMVAEYLFDSAESVRASTGGVITIRAAYIQIHKEVVQDLLSNDPQADRRIRNDPKRGAFIENLTERPLENAKGLTDLIDFGNQRRAVAATNMNETSSRSHVVVQLTMEQELPAAPSQGLGKRSIASKMSLVDLAGSERVQKTGAQGELLREAIAINQSLSALGNVINALTDPKVVHVPYRSSKLTQLLEESLGGNARTAMIAAVSPASRNYAETFQTLQYASRAKLIVTNASRNAQMDGVPVVPAFGAEQAEALHASLESKLEAAHASANERILSELQSMNASSSKERVDGLTDLKETVENLNAVMRADMVQREQLDQIASDTASAQQQAATEMRVWMSTALKAHTQALEKAIGDVMTPASSTLDEISASLAEFRGDMDRKAQVDKLATEAAAAQQQLSQQDLRSWLQGLVDSQTAALEKVIAAANAPAASSLVDVDSTLTGMHQEISSLASTHEQSASAAAAAVATSDEAAQRQVAKLEQEVVELRRANEEHGAATSHLQAQLSQMQAEADALRATIVERDAALEKHAAHEAELHRTNARLLQEKASVEDLARVERSALLEERRKIEERLHDEQAAAQAAQAALAKHNNFFSRLDATLNRPQRAGSARQSVKARKGKQLQQATRV